MPKKKLDKTIKLQIEAGKATPAPPLGPVLGAAKINIKAFCDEFNSRTKTLSGSIFPVVLCVYSDRSFSFTVKKPLVSNLIKNELKLKKGSQSPNRDKVGTLTKDQVKKIAAIKMEDMNAYKIEKAMRLVEGTAQSMGINIEA